MPNSDPRSQATPATEHTAEQDAARSAARAADPVLIKRAKIAKWTLLANRVGYLFVSLAMALFFMAFAFGFTSVMATLVIVAFVIGCVLLLPSIVLGYGVKAANREDRENGL